MSTDIVTARTPEPARTLSYGEHPDHVIDLFTDPDPDAGERSLVILLHGGFWQQRYDRAHLRPMAAGLAARGAVVAVPEYRRVGGAGGWPTTFLDVRLVVRVLPTLLATQGVEVSTVTLVGHSAGGQLALWMAAQLDWLTRVVVLAPVADLVGAASQQVGDGAVQELLGGEVEDFPQRYAAVDPSALLSDELLDTSHVTVIHGTDDRVVPISQSRTFSRVVPDARLVELPNVGHYELIDPSAAVHELVQNLVAPKLRAEQD